MSIRNFRDLYDTSKHHNVNWHINPSSKAPFKSEKRPIPLLSANPTYKLDFLNPASPSPPTKKKSDFSLNPHNIKILYPQHYPSFEKFFLSYSPIKNEILLSPPFLKTSWEAQLPATEMGDSVHTKMKHYILFDEIFRSL